MGINILIFLICICLFIIIGKIFIIPIKIILKLIFNSILGGVIIFAINLLGDMIGIHISINLLTCVIVGILGIPGIIVIILISLLL